MNFKKPLSLLLLAGIATAGMTASSNNNARKDELEAKIEHNRTIENAYTITTFYSAISTSIGSIALYNNITDYIKWSEMFKNHFQELEEAIQNAITSGKLVAHIDDAYGMACMFIRNVNEPLKEQLLSSMEKNQLLPALYSSKCIEQIRNNITLGTLATITTGIATIYCSVKAYQAWNKTKEVEQELATLSSNQT